MDKTQPLSIVSGVTGIPFLALALTLIWLVQTSHAKSEKTGTELQTLDPGNTVKEAAEIHFRRIMMDDVKYMKRAYADRVTLVAGHEYLKPKYGLVAKGERDKPMTLDRTKLIAIVKKHPKKISREFIDQMLQIMAVEVLEAKPGDFAMDPPDPVKTPDGKMHFQMEAGDKLIKVGPKKEGDFQVFQFRKIKGQWKVVAEHLD